MLREISKHPSNIAESAIKYLRTVRVSEKTKKIYTEVISLFLESLLSDPSAVVERAG